MKIGIPQIAIIIYIILILLLAIFYINNRAASTPPINSTLDDGYVTIAAHDTAKFDKSPPAANYICNGSDDQAVIQSAIDASQGKPILLLAGDYYKGNPEGIPVPSNTKIILSPEATIHLANNINADACIFTNANPGGDSNIQLVGGGTLDGNEQNEAAGDQYGIVFNNVDNTSVDLSIKNFRDFDVKKENSNINLTNRYFGSQYNNATLVYSGMTMDYGPGKYDLVIKFSSPVDLRNKAIQVSTNFDVIDFINYTVGGQVYTFSQVTDQSIPDIQGLNESEIKTIKVAADSETSGCDANLANVTSITLSQFVPAGSTLTWGNVWLEPLPQAPVVTICFDDGGDAFNDTFAPILANYGYRGVAALIGSYQPPSTASYHYLYDYYDWDIISHTYMHMEMDEISKQRIWEEMVNNRIWMEENNWTRGADVLAYPQNQGNYWDYEAASEVYTMTRSLGRYNAIADPKTEYIMNYQSTNDVNKLIMRAEKTHSWEILYYHRTNSSEEVNNACAALYDNGLDVVTFSDMLARENVPINTNWKANVSTVGEFTMKAGETSAILTTNLPVQPNNVTLYYDHSVANLTVDYGRIPYNTDYGDLVGVGTGSNTVFLATLAHKNIIPGTLEIHYTIDNTTYGIGSTGCIYDNGKGVLEGLWVGTGGQIDYSSGAIYLTFTAPPDSDTNVSAYYRYPDQVVSDAPLPQDLNVSYSAMI